MLQHSNILTIQLATINEPNTTSAHCNRLQYNKTKDSTTYHTSIHILTPRETLLIPIIYYRHTIQIKWHTTAQTNTSHYNTITLQSNNTCSTTTR